MTPREGFKYGFLLRCAEEGLTVEEAEARAVRGLEKRAEDNVLNTIGSDLYGGAKGLVTGIPGWVSKWGPRALGLGLGAAALGGGALGYGAAKLREGDVDPQEIQREELITAYRNQADLMRRKAIMDAMRRSQPRPKSFHNI